ncbi:MAG: hypothetical protein WBD34_06310 [Burkholderiaceae bacterium]
MRIPAAPIAVALLLACTMLGSAPVGAQAVNLLAGAADKLTDANLTADELAIVRQLGDGNKKLAPGVVANGIEYIVDLGDVFSAERLSVFAVTDKKSAPAAAAQIEILGSIASSQTGYQVLRSTTVQSGQPQLSLTFLPTAVRWIMLRITPAKKAKPLAIAEIEVFGKKGPPQSKYAFQDSPADAQLVLNRFREELRLKVSEDEQALFRDAADGQLDQWSLADAALLASGVSDAGQRADFRKRLDRMEKEARALLQSQPGVMKKGQQLLKYLHGKPLRGGYQEKQTDLSVLLSKGVYNCVSSAVLYSLLGTRLGLDVRGIEVPDHAYAIIYDGTKHADVETTNKLGFNPSRNRAAQQAFTKQTGFTYIPGSNAGKRRETSALGLIALIYYNHGVSHGKASRYEQALLAYYRALSIDPRLNSAVKNSLSSLGRWAEDVSRAGDNVRALSLLNTALALAPKDRNLIHNRRVIWHRRIADAVNQKDFTQVVALTSEAHQNDPAGGFDRQQARAFIQEGQTLSRQGKWAQALTVANDGAGKVNPESLVPLNRFRAGVIMNWMSTAIKLGDWTGALQAVGQGQNILPDDYRLQRNAAYLLQEWSEAAFAKGGADAGIAAVDAVLTVYPKNDGVRRAARNFVLRRVGELRDQGKEREAVAAVERYRRLLSDSNQANQLIESVFAGKANERIKARDWAAAATIYEQARDAAPEGGKNLRSYQQNVAYIAQEWLKDSGDAGGKLAADLLHRFADVRGLEKVVVSYYQRAVEQRQATGQFDAAADIAAAGFEQLKGNVGGLRLMRFTYDRWATHFSRQRLWQQAVDVYQRGLQAVPNDAHLTRNAIATWHGWAKPHLDKKEWQRALEIYEKGLEQLPGANLFRQNIRYCRQQISRQ